MQKKPRLYCALGGGLLAESRLSNGLPCETTDYTTMPCNESGVITLKKITDTFGPENIFLIILAKNPERKKEKLTWIQNNKIIQRIGLLENNIYFVATRLEKAELAKKLKVTIGIDDVIEPLLPLISDKTTYLFAYQPSDIQKYPTIAEGILIVQTWQEIRQFLKI